MRALRAGFGMLRSSVWIIVMQRRCNRKVRRMVVLLLLLLHQRYEAQGVQGRGGVGIHHRLEQPGEVVERKRGQAGHQLLRAQSGRVQEGGVEVDHRLPYHGVEEHPDLEIIPIRTRSESQLHYTEMTIKTLMEQHSGDKRRRRRGETHHHPW